MTTAGAEVTPRLNRWRSEMRRRAGSRALLRRPGRNAMRLIEWIINALHPAEPFESPSALRRFALDTATELRAQRKGDAGDVLESAAKLVTGSGWEWLGELHVAAERCRAERAVPEELRAKLVRIARVAGSSRPYGR